MRKSTSEDIYKDIKFMSKRIVRVLGALLIIAIILGGINYSYDQFKLYQREKIILSKDSIFAKSHVPLTFINNDFGDNTEIYLWFVGDTQDHAKLKINSEYSVFFDA